MVTLLYKVSLYILSFLHQTATLFVSANAAARCISYLSYIKPQPTATIFAISLCCISYLSYIKPQHNYDVKQRTNVVYLIFPTSNRN